MPSGVKKRKAARKKKQQEAIINSSRDEGCKSQNGRSSESREINVTYDRHECHDQLDGNNDEYEENGYAASPVLSTVDEDKSLDIERFLGNKEVVHELGSNTNGSVKVENNLNSAKSEITSTENNAGQGISSKYIEPEKKFDERDEESSSSSSSSAEEYNIADKKNKAYTSSYEINVCSDKPDKSSQATIAINESASVGECINSFVETTLVADSVKSEVPVSTEKICLMKAAAVEKLVVSDIVTSGWKEDANTLLLNQCDGTRASSFSNLDSRLKDNATTQGSEISRCYKNQSLASAPILAQRTSIFSCCGLFDLLKGSN